MLVQHDRLVLIASHQPLRLIVPVLGQLLVYMSIYMPVYMLFCILLYMLPCLLFSTLCFFPTL